MTFPKRRHTTTTTGDWVFLPDKIAAQLVKEIALCLTCVDPRLDSEPSVELEPDRERTP